MADKKIKLEDRMSDEQKLISKISSFFALNLKTILIGVGALLAILLIVVIVSVTSSSSKEKDFIALSNCEDKVSEVLSSKEGIEDLISELNGFVGNSAYVSQKAQYLIGVLYSGEEKYSESYDAFIKCKNLNSKTYLANLSLLNAAVCKDNLGDNSAALDLYNQVAGSDDMGLASRALYNIGRIYYQENKMDLAKSTFETLMDSYPDSEFSKIAKNIVSLM